MVPARDRRLLRQVEEAHARAVFGRVEREVVAIVVVVAVVLDLQGDRVDVAVELLLLVVVDDVCRRILLTRFVVAVDRCCCEQ